MGELGDSVTVKTVFKMFDTNMDGRITREDVEMYAAQQRDKLKQLNPVEAENVYKSLVKTADIFGLDKPAKDGGLSYSPREFEIVRRIVGKKDFPDAIRAVQTAQFRAIDTDGDGAIQRNEWSNYLQLCKVYTSDKNAKASFDSLDKNKNGIISLPEFVESGVDFWCNTDEKILGTEDMYGTKDL